MKIPSLFLFVFFGIATLAAQGQGPRIPVILDTDINADLDDTYALVQALKDSHLDLKLVTTTSYNAEERARLIAKLLSVAGRTDVPIGLGDKKRTFPRGSQAEWVGDYKLSDYPGTVYDDGVQSMIDLINQSPVPVTIIAVGPLKTVSEALTRDPGIAAKANITIMNGNISALRDKETGEIRPEGNTKNAIPETRQVFAAPWKSIIIAPLDTAILRLMKRERALYDAAPGEPLLNALTECKEAFITVSHPDLHGWRDNGEPKFGQCLFDCAAVYLADTDPKMREWIQIKKMKIKVTDDGKTLEDPEGNEIQVAIAWNNQEAFLDYLADLLMKPTPKP